jgi:seryl-tRNA synthetase
MSKVLDSEKLGQQIRELEAIRNYEQVKLQRDDALAQVKQLQSKLNEFGNLEQQKNEVMSSIKKANENSIRILREALAELPKKLDQRRQDLTESGLLEAVETVIENEVDQKLRIAADEKLNLIYRNEIEKQVKWMLNTAWPTALLGKRTQEKEKTLNQKLSVHPFVALRGRWQVPCQKCGVRHELVLDKTSDIKSFLAEGNATIDAGSVHGMFARSYNITITLGQVVELFLAKKED